MIGPLGSAVMAAIFSMLVLAILLNRREGRRIKAATPAPVIEPEDESVFGKHFFAIRKAGQNAWTIYRFQEGVLPQFLFGALPVSVWSPVGRALAERMIEEFDGYVERCAEVKP